MLHNVVYQIQPMSGLSDGDHFSFKWKGIIVYVASPPIFQQLYLLFFWDVVVMLIYLQLSLTHRRDLISRIL